MSRRLRSSTMRSFRSTHSQLVPGCLMLKRWRRERHLRVRRTLFRSLVARGRAYVGSSTQPSHSKDRRARTNEVSHEADEHFPPSRRFVVHWRCAPSSSVRYAMTSTPCPGDSTNAAKERNAGVCNEHAHVQRARAKLPCAPPPTPAVAGGVPKGRLAPACDASVLAFAPGGAAARVRRQARPAARAARAHMARVVTMRHTWVCGVQTCSCTLVGPVQLHTRGCG